LGETDPVRGEFTQDGAALGGGDSGRGEGGTQFGEGHLSLRTPSGDQVGQGRVDGDLLGRRASSRRFFIRRGHASACHPGYSLPSSAIGTRRRVPADWTRQYVQRVGESNVPSLDWISARVA